MEPSPRHPLTPVVSSARIRVSFLCDRFTAQNTAALLAPVIRFRREVLAAGIEATLAFDEASARGADLVVVLDRAVFARHTAHATGFTGEIKRLGDLFGGIVFFDTGDSSGQLRTAVLSRVRAYWKPFLLRDRTQYRERHYGGRLFTDAVHREFGIVDQEPLWSEPVEDVGLLSRLRVAWSPALYPYGPVSNRLAKLYARLPAAPLLRPSRLVAPDRPRAGVACRISAGHRRETVAHQRRALLLQLTPRMETGVVTQRQYHREMRRARAVISPFGWGEFALRDYETLLAGAALIKPDMSNLETWPNLYRPGETYLPVDWNWAGLAAILDRVESDPEGMQTIAAAGQAAYGTAVRDGAAFALRLRSLVTAALDGAAG